MEQIHNTSTSISNTSTTKLFSNISSTNTTSLPKQQENSNLSQSNKNTQYNPLANLFPLTSLETLSTKNIHTSSMEIDLSTDFQDSPATNQFLNKDTNQTQPISTQSQNLPLNEPKPKPNPSYDWLLNFPITEEIEPNKKFQTKLSHQLFGFLKKHLFDFFPGKEIKSEKKNQPAYKASFKHLLCSMASQHPDFLIDLIFEHNSDISKNATIPFDYLESTFKNITLQFTTILFKKLNYKEIFAFLVTILPYKIQN